MTNLVTWVVGVEGGREAEVRETRRVCGGSEAEVGMMGGVMERMTLVARGC